MTDKELDKAAIAVLVASFLWFVCGMFFGLRWNKTAPFPGYGLSVGIGAASQPTTTAIDRSGL